MKETSADLDHLLEVCRRIELTMASLYRFLRQRHRGAPDIAGIWLKTSNDEENHAR